MGHLEILIVEAVQKEVQKIWNDSFGAFTLQKIHQMIIGGREEFYQNFSNYTYAGFLDI